MNLHKNLSLRDAIKAARELGCEVEMVSSHGEVRFKYPGMRFHTRSANHHDAGKGLVSWLRKVSEMRPAA